MKRNLKAAIKIIASLVAVTMFVGSMSIEYTGYASGINIQDIVQEGEVIYSIVGNGSKEPWAPMNIDNMLEQTEFEGVYKIDYRVSAAEDGNEWARRFGIIQTSTQSCSMWNRILLGVPQATTEITDTTSQCLTFIRINVEEDTEVTIYFDSKTYGIAVKDMDGNDVPYLVSWVGNDDDEIYYTPEELTNISVKEYIANLSVETKSNRIFDLSICGIDQYSDMPDFVKLRDQLSAKLEGSHSEDYVYDGAYGENFVGYEGYAECLISDDGLTVMGYIGAPKEIVIPEGITRIDSGAFHNCSSLTKIEIPTSVISIEDSAFSGCNSLSEIEIPTSVTSMGDYAFGGCSSLTKIEIPTSVTSIGYGVFWGCSSLTEIEIPTSVTSIGGAAFYNCSSLSEIEIPTSVTSIGGYAFYNCSSLSEIEIPTSVTDIGYYAFGYYYDDEKYEDTKMDEFTIYGYSGTEAEKYAKDNGFKFIRMSDLHSDDEVIIKFASDSLPEKAELVTELIDTASEKYTKISENFEKYLSGLSKEESATIKYRAYEIHVTDNNNNIVQPKDKVTVSIPLPEVFAGKDSKVYRIEDNGSLTDMNAKVQGKYFVFETNHFSLYLVVNHNISGNILYGDANGDGAIDSADAVLIKKYLAGYKDLGINEEACDVNLDGEVTSADAVLVLKKLAGYDVVLGK